MTYQDVIDWCFDNFDVDDYDDFESFLVDCDKDFEQNGRNSIYDMLPPAWMKQFEREFYENQTTKGENEEEQLEREYEEELQKSFEEQEKKVQDAIKSTGNTPIDIQFETEIIDESKIELPSIGKAPSLELRPIKEESTIQKITGFLKRLFK